VCGLLCTHVCRGLLAPLVHSQINHFLAKIYYAARRTGRLSAVLLIFIYARIYTVYSIYARIQYKCAQGCGVSAGYCGYAWTLEGAAPLSSVKPRTAGSTAYGLLQLARPVPYPAPPSYPLPLPEPTATLHATRYGLTAPHRRDRTQYRRAVRAAAPRGAYIYTATNLTP
jgi:hypothetical protein